MAASSKLQLRLHLVADILAVAAARMESATRRWVDRAGNVTLEDDSFLFVLRIRNGHSGKKRPSIRVFSVAVDGLAGGDFDNLSQIHDRHSVADMLDHPEIVRNEKIGEMHLLLELLEEIDDLRLDGDIQGGDRLIGYDELRIHGQCPGDADPLPLAAAELMRITIVVLFSETYLV